MKKLSIILAVVLVAVVGSVYATWNYAEEGTAEQNKTLATNITTITKEGAKGTINVVGNSLSLKYEDSDHNFYVDSWVPEGELDITFEPNAHANPDIVESGISMEWCVCQPTWVLTDYTYNDVQVILNVNSEWQKVNNGQPTKHFTLNAQELIDRNLIEYNPLLYLPTSTDYDSFRGTLGNHGFSILIRETPATPPQN